MINLIIATNIYTKNPHRNDMDFHALEKLGKANKVLSHIPYIVEKEFQTQQFIKSKKYMDSIKSNLENIIRNNLTSKTDFIKE